LIEEAVEIRAAIEIIVNQTCPKTGFAASAKA
jgi:hypothetical protein